MAETNPSLEERLGNVRRYQPAEAGITLLNDGRGKPYAVGAVETLFEELKGDPVYEKTVRATEGAVENLLNLSYSQYLEARGELTIGELYDNFYSDSVKGMIKDDEKKKTKKENYKYIEEEFKKYADEKLGDIMKKFAKANTLLKDKLDLFTKEQMEDAKKTKDKYQKLMEYMERLDYRDIEKRKAGAIEKANELYFNQQAIEMRDGPKEK